MYAAREGSVKNLVGKRVRCIPTGNVYRAVEQAAGEIVGLDEETGERVVLPLSRVVQHSPLLICVGAVIQTVILADYAPLGESAHLIRGGFLGSVTLAVLAWSFGMSVPVVLLAYLMGGLIGVATSATLRFRQRARRRKSRRLASREAATGRQSEEHASSSGP